MTTTTTLSQNSVQVTGNAIAIGYTLLDSNIVLQVAVLHAGNIIAAYDECTV